MVRAPCLPSTVLLLAAFSGCGAAEPTFLTANGYASLAFQERETRAVEVRLQAQSGMPVAGGRVRFGIEGLPNGSVLESVVVQTDAQGIARTNLLAGDQANFYLVADAEGAQRLMITVSVSRANGGALDVTVLPERAAGGARQAQVTVIDNLNCADFDPMRPPAPASMIQQPQRTVYLDSAAGGRVRFTGLRADRHYAVMALVYSGNTPVAKGCVAGVSITEDQITRTQAVSTSLTLEPYDAPNRVDPALGEGLLVETNFKYGLGFERLALLIDDISNDPADPIDYVVSRALQRGAGQGWTSELVKVSKAQIVSHVQAQLDKLSAVKSARSKLQQLASRLKKLTNIKMYSTLDIETELTGETDQVLTGTHRLEYFTSGSGTDLERYYVGSGVRIFDSPAPQTLETQISMVMESGYQMRVNSHTLSFPVADAVVGSALLEVFNEYQVDSIFAALVDCHAMGVAAGELYKQNVDAGADAIALLIETGMSSACRSALMDVSALVYTETMEDVARAGLLGETLNLYGTASVTKLPSGTEVDRLTGGKWSDLGTFVAKNPDEYTH